MKYLWQSVSFNTTNTKIRRANMSKNIDELPEGGMGVKIMSDLADELNYRRTYDDKNCLFMVKNYEQQGLDQPQTTQKRGFLDRLNWFKSKGHRQQRSDTPLTKIHLRVNTELQALEQVLNWYEQLQNLPIPPVIFQQCQLALAEGFTNAVRHAHQGLPAETPIELEVTVFHERLEIRIWDYGQQFDIEAKLRELTQIHQDPLEAEGGRGLSFMFKLADQVTYTRISDERNCLVIVKCLPPSSTR
jgi:serine/threonine-protein kinase RsbW